MVVKLRMEIRVRNIELRVIKIYMVMKDTETVEEKNLRLYRKKKRRLRQKCM